MRRWIPVLVLLLVGVLAVWWLLLRDSGDGGSAKGPPPRPTAVIGSGSGAVAVGPDGQVLPRAHIAEGERLPELSLDEPPKSGRLAGPAREQARVLGAAPPALRPYLERSYYGESGVDVVLRSGIELRFGDASQARKKWEAAAAVLADPSVTTPGYVNLQAPGRPSVGGSGHTLPPVE